MFAVPAFQSLSSESLKSSFEKRSGGGGVDACRNPANLSSTPNHRKRKRPQYSAESNAASDVSPDNIGELWSTIVEGRSDAATASGKPANIATAAAGATARAGATTADAAAAAPNPQQAGQKRERRDKGPKSKPRTHSRDDELSLGKKKRSKVDHEGDSSSASHPPTGASAPAAVSPSSRKIKSVKQSDNHPINHPDAHDPISISTSAAHAGAQTAPAVAAGPTSDAPSKAPTLTPLQEKMRQKLSGARFRHLNQLLYTTPSRDSLALFSSQPDMFADYHAGFRQQVEAWPENPVDIFINRLFARGRLRDSGHRGGKFHHKHGQTGASVANATPLGGSRGGGGASASAPASASGAGNGIGFHDALGSLPLPRARDGFTTVIDLGCGEAALAKAITSAKPRPKIKVHSYDLHSPNPLVTVADIAHLPLPDNSVDVAIFCLALMGTNWPAMIEEAVRVLRNGGEVWIAEIKSRFARTKTGLKDGGDSTTAGKEGSRRNSSKGGRKSKGGKEKEKDRDDTDPADAFVEERDGSADQNRWAAGEQSFIEALGRRGLRLKNRNGSNKMFVSLDFEKVGAKDGHAFQIPPKPDMHGRVSRKFHSDDDVEVDESSILQPCLYKIR
ncbi:25S rRNA (adenine645-N1)-methyltransferase [Orbilia brochopaga]|uniref:Ribosomal RNA-processing protein 8 n=1 Tax=Orbilia brochopaga TaxID=3140254 RepID=A0AAV9UFN8_9PEZI